MAENHDILSRELEHHEQIYAGFAQEHFAKPAVRAFRRDLVRRIVSSARLTKTSRVLSLGCGIGDTELLLAPHIGHIVGLDLSPAAIRQAMLDAESAGAGNVQFVEGSLETIGLPDGSFDAIIAVFFLHHLSDEALRDAAFRSRRLMNRGGVFYGLDPSRYRLSGAVGRLLVPQLMAKHQSPDERELRPALVRKLFRQAGFAARLGRYDFFSTPVAGLFPGSARLYRFSRIMDEVMIRLPLLRLLGSNFEIIAHNPESPAG